LTAQENKQNNKQGNAEIFITTCPSYSEKPITTSAVQERQSETRTVGVGKSDFVSEQQHQISEIKHNPTNNTIQSLRIQACIHSGLGAALDGVRSLFVVIPLLAIRIKGLKRSTTRYNLRKRRMTAQSK
jgi:hypothetical protein